MVHVSFLSTGATASIRSAPSLSIGARASIFFLCYRCILVLTRCIHYKSGNFLICNESNRCDQYDRNERLQQIEPRYAYIPRSILIAFDKLLTPLFFLLLPLKLALIRSQFIFHLSLPSVILLFISICFR